MLNLTALTQGVRPYILLCAMMIALALPGALHMPVMDRDEARFTQATSQMLETGDYVVIRYHDGLRNKKPVGIHWMQAASVAAVSDVEKREIWAYRLPSLFGAILAACGLFWAGAALFNRRAAFSASILLGSTLLLSSEAHIAKTDAALVGFIVLGMAALAKLRLRADQEHPSNLGGKLLSLVFWLGFGVSTLIKGPVGPMVLGLTVVALAIWERRIKWLTPLSFWPGPVMAILIVVPWFIAVQLATGGVFLNEAVGVDLGPKLVSGAEGHLGPPGYHLAGLPLLFWPATLFLIPGLVVTVSQSVSSKSGDPLPWRFLLAWAIPTWLVFEIMPTKLAHYTMPAYPALALMAGAAIDRLIKDTSLLPAWSRWVSLVLFAFGGVLVAAIMSPWGLSAFRAEAASDFLQDAGRVADIWKQDWSDVGAPFWPFLLTLLALIAAGYFFVKRNFEAALAGIVACSLVAGVSLRTVLLPQQTWIIATDAAIAALNDVCGMPEGPFRKTACASQAPKIVRAIAYAEPSFVFSVKGETILPPKTDAILPPRSEDQRPVWLIDIRDPDGEAALAQITSQAADADRCVRLSRRFVKNYSNNDAQELVAVAVEPDLCSPRPVEPEPTITPE